ncbi:uncharacterized protein L203_104910 [Cryptococcus depauperatus CBS 7841]|uniref:Uncharacterized protein n=1 Tax=Cryptococcus depauperatus CBS 7841 TaxID=1295531 RepID=A0A1E3IMY9_9TREE|nr:hypothetical protein L203_01881 [Cryptococcus depauperatus CBS 7841]
MSRSSTQQPQSSSTLSAGQPSHRALEGNSVNGVATSTGGNSLLVTVEGESGEDPPSRHSLAGLLSTLGAFRSRFSSQLNEDAIAHLASIRQQTYTVEEIQKMAEGIVSRRSAGVGGQLESDEDLAKLIYLIDEVTNRFTEQRLASEQGEPSLNAEREQHGEGDWDGWTRTG